MFLRNPLVPIGCLAFALAGCGGASATDILADGGSGSQSGNGAGGDDGGSIATLAVHVRANTSTFDHTDGLSGQTTTATKAGIRSLRLLRQQGDPTPVELFDHGANPVEAGYDDGDDTVVARVPAATLVPGHYTLARLVQTHSHFTVTATLHDHGQPYPGSYEDILVVSDATMLGGTLRSAGYYDFKFTDAYGTADTSGSGWPVAGYTTTSGAVAVVEAGEWAVYFPVDLDVAAPPANGSKLFVDVNMYQAFRWVDELAPGYLPGVFDTTAASYEPVIRYGGNRFELTLAP